MLVVVVEESLGPEMGRDVDAGMEGAVVWVVAQMLAVGAEAGAGAGAGTGTGAGAGAGAGAEPPLPELLFYLERVTHCYSLTGSALLVLHI